MSTVSVSWCLVLYTGRNSGFTHSGLCSGSGAFMVLFVPALYQSRVYHWLKGKQNLACLVVVVFSRSCDFPMRWAYEKHGGVNTYYFKAFILHSG